MSSDESAQSQEAKALVQALNQYLASLATSLNGRLWPNEEEMLGKLFEVQLSLQSLLNEDTPSHSASLSLSPPMDNAYAQTLRYAQDLVKAIRQQKEHQRRLEYTSQQLIRAEKLAMVGQVAATVAHELNNILTPLLMYARLIYQETANGEKTEVAEFAAQITEIAHRASDMLRQLVDASRSESHITIPVDLSKVIANTLTFLAPRINSQNIIIEQSYPPNLSPVKGNPGQLEQVFINMALNAFDAMPEGGKFTITIYPNSEPGQQSTGQAGYMTIYLSDTGEGIPTENISKLFEPFFTTKARGAGAGLGLFVSYLIINQHNGTIEIESKPGVGATFIIKLPTMGRDEA